jgi:hypothetical protein
MYKIVLTDRAISKTNIIYAASGDNRPKESMFVQQKNFEKIDEQLVQQVLTPYAHKGTEYLQEAYAECKSKDPHTVESVINHDTGYVVRGRFSITESCYIDDTGHFNAAEFNICYNQLVYVTLAHSVSQQLLHCLRGLTLEEFYRKQLPDIYITRLESFYKKPIDSRNFFGILTINKTKIIRELIIIKTEIEFSDDYKGWAYGNVDLAIK